MKHIFTGASLRIDQDYNIGCECYYIGCLFLDRSLIKGIQLTVNDFYLPLNQDLFYAIVSRKDEHFVNIVKYLCTSNEWDEIELMEYVNHIINSTHSLDNFLSYEKILLEKSVHRRLKNSRLFK